MKINLLSRIFLASAVVFSIANCAQNAPEPSAKSDTASTPLGGGQASVQDNDSQKDIVKIAAGSADHTTLVAALKAADYLNVVSNAGPFTVFAPTNAAFSALPAGTVEGLLKPEKKDDLRNILEYHVAVAVYKPEMLRDGQKINMANGDDITITVKDGKIMVNGGAHIVASIPATNGIIHVLDGVLLPPAK